MTSELQELVGKKVNKIYVNSSHLKFETDQGNLVYEVDGDCCSSSYFYDFYGVKNLLENGKVTEIKTVELDPTDLRVTKKSNHYDDCIQVYGFQITTESAEYGEVTSVFSFRNSSNGYYGGGINKVADRTVLPPLEEDIVEIK